MLLFAWLMMDFIILQNLVKALRIKEYILDLKLNLDAKANITFQLTKRTKDIFNHQILSMNTQLLNYY